MSTTTEPKPIRVGFHMGNVITFLSHLYGNGFSVLREAVQNSIDEGATKIFVSIHCERRMVKIYDNGRGANKDDITTKFENIGWSLKQGDPDKIGSRGIGNLAGLAGAREWQFISKKGGGPFVAYTFNKSELAKSEEINLFAEDLTLKQIDRDCPFTANSLLRLIDVSEIMLKQLGDRDTIERTLREAFNTKLRLNNIELRIAYSDFKNKKCEFMVKPVAYRGAEMEVVRQDTPLGYVEFAFFHNPNPIQNPSILVQHQGVYTIPMVNFFKLKILPKEIEHLFFKGYFEGEIRVGFCSVNASRSAFEFNSELDVFVETIRTFAEDVLKPIIDQFEQADREERWKRIAESVLKIMRTYFQKNPALVPPTLKTMVFKPSENVGDTSQAPGVGIRKPGTTTTPTKKKARQPLPPDALRKQKGESEQKKRTPSGTTANKQKEKVVDFSEGLGIQFVHPDPETDGFLWHSRTSKTGVIQINVVNNQFLEAERRGQNIVRDYLMRLLHKELICASLPPADSASFDAGYEMMMEHFWRSSLL